MPPSKESPLPPELREPKTLLSYLADATDALKHHWIAGVLFNLKKRLARPAYFRDTDPALCTWHAEMQRGGFLCARTTTGGAARLLWARTVAPPARKGKSVIATCVIAREIDAPDGVKPIGWRLLTNREAATPEAVVELIDWYRAHWEIEMLFNVLKNACRVEALQLGSITQLERGALGDFRQHLHMRDHAARQG